MTRLFKENGNSLIELLVGLLLVWILVPAAFFTFRSSVSHSADNETITRAEEKARSILDMMVYDLRLMGSGMPLGQDSFSVTDNTLGDAPLPLLTSSDDESFTIRINPQGRESFVTSSYTPAAGSLTVSLDNTDDLVVGDTVYLHNMLTGGGEGMKAEVSAVTNSSVTFTNSYVAPSGAVFDEGSVLARVEEVTYESDSVNNLITRTDSQGTITIATNATFSAEYTDGNGNLISPALSESEIEDDLAGIVLDISVNSAQNISNGSPYTALASQVVTHRNPNIARVEASGSNTGSGGNSSTTTTTTTTTTTGATPTTSTTTTTGAIPTTTTTVTTVTTTTVTTSTTVTTTTVTTTTIAACLPHNAACTVNSQCCSGTCRNSNNKCTRP